MVITVTLNPAMDKTLILDDFTTGEVNRVVSVRHDIGGKGINVSKVLKEFSIDSVAIGFLGGIFEEVFRKELKKRGIAERFVSVAGSTRTNTKVVDRKNGIYTDINEPGPVITKGELEKFYSLYDGIVKAGDVVVLSGGICQGLPGDIYGILTRKAKAKGAKVIVDAEGEYLRQALLEGPDMIKPNDKELAALVGKEQLTEEEIIIEMKNLLKNGLEKVLVSRGEKGSLLVTRKGTYKGEGLKVEVRSTVGAGDSMVAALVYSELEHLDDRRTLVMAQAAGAAAVMTEGTEACTLDDVKKLLVYAEDKIMEVE